MTDQPPVPVFQPHVGLDTIKAVVDALHAGWLGMGAVTQAFEDGLARFLGLDARYVLATNTGTSVECFPVFTTAQRPSKEAARTTDGGRTRERERRQLPRLRAVTRPARGRGEMRRC